MTAQDIADTLDWELSVVEKALNVLCHNDLQWITQVDSRESPEFPGISREFPTRSDQIRSGQIRTDQPKTRGRARAASAVSDSADSAGSEAGSSLPAPAGPEPTTRRNTEPASPAPEPARPATITGSAVPEYPQNAPRASCAVSGNPEIQTKTDTNNLTEVISQIQRQPSRDYLNDLFRRIKRVSNDPKHWVDWWKQALPQVVANDRLHAALTEALGYAEDCANPATRQVKGLGPHRAPGAYITSKLLEAARSAGVRLPKLPTREDAA
jgi:hypothetical protein